MPIMPPSIQQLLCDRRPIDTVAVNGVVLVRFEYASAGRSDSDRIVSEDRVVDADGRVSPAREDSILAVVN